MKRICFGLVLMALVLNASNTAIANPNPKMLKDLNELLVILTKSLAQYESRQSQFNAQMPYLRIVPGRKFQINELRELIVKLEGIPKEVDMKEIIIEEVDNIIDGMLVDAAQELGIVEISNMLLYTYEELEMKQFAQKLRDSSNFFYMLFDNISQFAMMPLLRGKTPGMMQPERSAPTQERLEEPGFMPMQNTK
ncbi:MAG: hypothetical protein V1739_02180 [Candidatus Omnitrophota bacterium]